MWRPSRFTSGTARRAEVDVSSASLGCRFLLDELAAVIGPAGDLSGDLFAWLCTSEDRFGAVLSPRLFDSTVRQHDQVRNPNIGALDVKMRDGLIYFSLSNNWEAINSQLSLAQMRSARCELVKLVITCLPDPFLDPMWEIVLERCRDVLKSTIVPYLSFASSAEKSQM